MFAKKTVLISALFALVSSGLGMADELVGQSPDKVAGLAGAWAGGAFIPA